MIGTAILLNSVLGMGSLPAAGLDLSKAVVVAPPNLTGPEKAAVTMLVEEVEKRAQIRWAVTTTWPSGETPVVAVGPASAVKGLAGPYAEELSADGGAAGAEGYRIRTRKSERGPAVLVIGNDARGVLFGVGRLLRTLRMTPGSILLDDDLNVATKPHYPLRGHQLGYRPKTNSYDAWDLAQWEQYIRDLVVFGVNAIELLPPRTDDAAKSPHFPLPAMEMMVGMSGLADTYGIDVWVWYPAMDRDYSDPATVESALKEWAGVLDKLPRVNAVFVPGGDPGHTQPRYLMALLEKQADNLRRTHPGVQMWVSPQGFDKQWMDEFLGILKDGKPAWLSGVVFGPQVRMSLPELREAVPQQYPIRHYPDITHTRQCQYPVPDWDQAYAVTEARECINPRPLGQAAIFRLLQPYTVGFITYSEGCNDDVNKFVWSGLGWNPDAKVIDILREYSRYFIGDRYTDDFAQGLLALERNWQGPLRANENVHTTLAQFQAMEKGATPRQLQNWRFQQALYRAYYDAYIRIRLLYESGLEERAMEVLRQARTTGTLPAMAEAERILDEALLTRVSADWRARVFELAEAMFQSIGMQTSVARYKAISVDRGATLDTIDYPLNNRRWLKARFNALRKLETDSERLKTIEEILDWTNPSPGGFYDDLGSISRQPHLVAGPGFEKDPGFAESSRVGFEEEEVIDPDVEPSRILRTSWVDHAETLYDVPLRMHYSNLDPAAAYKIRVVYAGDSPRRKIRLVANDNVEVHPFVAKPVPCGPVEFEIPAAATRTGSLDLSWYGEPGRGGNGRGCQVSEVWLIKK